MSSGHESAIGVGEGLAPTHYKLYINMPRALPSDSDLPRTVCASPFKRDVKIPKEVGVVVVTSQRTYCSDSQTSDIQLQAW
jgi:hypothetical protein